MNKIFVVISLLALVLTSCFSPWNGDEVSFTITIGNLNNRAVHSIIARSSSTWSYDTWHPNDHLRYLTHVITLSSLGVDLEPVTLTGGVTTHRFSVAPGNWNIKVEARLDGVLIAEANENRDITQGTNSVTIEMKMAEGFEIASVEFYLNKENIANNNRYDIKHIPKGTRAGIPNVPSIGNDKVFVTWINLENEEVFNFNNPVTDNIILIAKWDDPIHAITPVFTITFAAIQDLAPSIETGITIYHFGTPGGKPSSTAVLTVEGTYKAINWFINGIFIQSGNALTLDSANELYNAVGNHILTLEVQTTTDFWFGKAVSFSVALDDN